MKKLEIQEIIDSDGNIIGKEDKPENGADLETQADKTTDYNARAHAQNYKNDFLGRFGFYFYEGSGNEKPAVVEDIENVLDGDSIKAMAVMEAIKPHLENAIDEMNTNINEAKVVEDKITTKKDDKSVKKNKDNNDLSKVEKVADLLSKLDKTDLSKLMNILEEKLK